MGETSPKIFCCLRSLRCSSSLDVSLSFSTSSCPARCRHLYSHPFVSSEKVNLAFLFRSICSKHYSIFHLSQDSKSPHCCLFKVRADGNVCCALQFLLVDRVFIWLVLLRTEFPLSFNQLYLNNLRWPSGYGIGQGIFRLWVS